MEVVHCVAAMAMMTLRCTAHTSEGGYDSHNTHKACGSGWLEVAQPNNKRHERNNNCLWLMASAECMFVYVCVCVCVCVAEPVIVSINCFWDAGGVYCV